MGSEVLGPECRPPVGILWTPVNPCAAGLHPLYLKILDSGGLDLQSWCLDAWMLEGLAWIGGCDGSDGILGRGDWKKFLHAQASGARRIYSPASQPIEVFFWSWQSRCFGIFTLA